MKNILVKQFGNPTIVMDEDGLFRCNHENAEVDPACCNGSPDECGRMTCGCEGRDSVYCPDCHNEDMTDDEAELIMEGYYEKCNQRY